MRVNIHLFHDVIDIMFPFITMLGGMIKSSTQTAWWAILFRLLFVCVVLILISTSIILEVLPAVGMSSKLLRTPAPAWACVDLIPLEIWFSCATILCTILLWCTSLIAVVLKLMLTMLRSLSSILWSKSSKLSISALTIIRSAALTLIRCIMIVIVGVLIIIALFHLLGFWWVLPLILRFSFRFPSTSGLFWFCAFKRLRYISLFLCPLNVLCGNIILVLLHLLPSLALPE